MKSTRLLLALVALAVLTLVPAAADEAYKYKYLDKQKLSSSSSGPEGTAVLSFNVYVPIPKTAGEKLPAIMFPNSWACNQYEYKEQAQKFASQGYVVLSYATRGWGGSTGMIEAGGRGDMADVSHLIDWLLANTPTDPERIGMSGISYGAGISLLGAAHDPRIKAVVAMSGWASLFVSLDSNGTPSALWTKILQLAAEATGGRLNPFMTSYVKAASAYQITDAMRQEAMTRSPFNFLNTYNQRQTAIMFSNNFEDDLFSASDVWTMYRQLQVPKRMLLNQGQHAQAEDGGLHGKPSYVWDNAHAFFDRYLKKVPGPSLSMPSGLAMMQPYKLTDYYAVDPSNPMQVQPVQYGLGKGPDAATGVLTPPDAPPVSFDLRGGLTTATSGTPPSAILDILQLKVLTLPWVSMETIDRRHAAVFLSQPIPDTLRVRGIPQATLPVTITGSGSKMSNIAAQMVAYFYDVDEKGVGTLLSFGPITLFGDPPENLTVKVPMRITAYDFAKGHRLGLVVGTEDPLYGLKASVWRHDKLTVRSLGANGKSATIEIPVLK